jgi:hypothetical protein
MAGVLEIIIVENPIFDKHTTSDFNTGRVIYLDEWNELFRSVLKAPEIVQRETEDYYDFIDRLENSFQEHLTAKGYEMLGRIWFIYRDVYYNPSEIRKLLEECLNVQKETKNKLALSAIESLIYGCNEGLKAKSGVLLSSD